MFCISYGAIPMLTFAATATGDACEVDLASAPAAPPTAQLAGSGSAAGPSP